MTSAPNHLLRLSGNNIMWLLLLFTISCSAPKKVAYLEGTQIIKSDRVSHQVQDTIIQPKTIGEPVKMDTIQWENISNTKKSIESGVEVPRLNKKELYHVKLLIPLNSDETADPASSRFVHFYAGASIALEELDEEGIKLNVDIIDTQEGSFKTTEEIVSIFSDNPDLIIGPFERDDLKIMTEECKSRKIPLVSPWHTSSKLTYENPYYIQMKPNLRLHFLKLVEYAIQNYNSGEVVIVGKNNKDTNAWIKYFQEEAAKTTGNKNYFSSYFVNTDSLKNGPTAYFNMFKNNNVKAILFPHYSFDDESFIYSCLRRLSAEKANRNISVIGMPLLYDSDKVDFDFYHALQMKIVISDFVDEDHGKIRAFRRSYLERYGEIPNADAVKGYDLMLYLGRSIWKYGVDFPSNLTYEATSYLQSTFNVQQATSDESKITNDAFGFDYYENKYLDIIEFKGGKWQRTY
jgi:hypothetical protein